MFPSAHWNRSGERIFHDTSIHSKSGCTSRKPTVSKPIRCNYSPENRLGQRVVIAFPANWNSVQLCDEVWMAWPTIHFLLSLRKTTGVNSPALHYSRSSWHEFCNLSFIDVPNYFPDSNPREIISLILRSRCGLLNFNARAFRNNTIGLFLFSRFRWKHISL